MRCPGRPISDTSDARPLGVDTDFVKSIFKFPTAATRKKFWEISRLEPDFHTIVCTIL
jgi:hypothetical protein